MIWKSRHKEIIILVSVMARNKSTTRIIHTINQFLKQGFKVKDVSFSDDIDISTLYREITIQVISPPNHGKSRLAYALKEFLKDNGFEVELTDSDFLTEESFDEMMKSHFEEVIGKIKNTVKITLKVRKINPISTNSVVMKVSDKAFQRNEKIDEILKL